VQEDWTSNGADWAGGIAWAGPWRKARPLCTTRRARPCGSTGGSQNGTVWGDSWTRAAGFSGWTNLGGVLSGALSAIYDPDDQNVEVYGRGEDDLAQEGPLAGENWTGWHDLGGAAIATRPIALFDPFDSAIEMWETENTSNGTTFDDAWTPSTGWSGWQNRGGVVASALVPIYDLASGSLRVFGVGIQNGTVWGDTLAPSAGFSGRVNMSGILQITDFEAALRRLCEAALRGGDFAR
jgi:hypothetical protein